MDKRDAKIFVEAFGEDVLKVKNLVEHMFSVGEIVDVLVFPEKDVAVFLSNYRDGDQRQPLPGNMHSLVCVCHDGKLQKKDFEWRRKRGSYGDEKIFVKIKEGHVSDWYVRVGVEDKVGETSTIEANIISMREDVGSKARVFFHYYSGLAIPTIMRGAREVVPVGKGTAVVVVEETKVYHAQSEVKQKVVLFHEDGSEVVLAPFSNEQYKIIDASPDAVVLKNKTTGKKERIQF